MVRRRSTVRFRKGAPQVRRVFRTLDWRLGGPKLPPGCQSLNVDGTQTTSVTWAEGVPRKWGAVPGSEALRPTVRGKLPGRAAERLVLAEASTGVADDLMSATALATQMVRDYGLSDKIGPVSHSDPSAGHPGLGTPRGYSERTQWLVDQEVTALLTIARNPRPGSAHQPPARPHPAHHRPAGAGNHHRRPGPSPRPGLQPGCSARGPSRGQFPAMTMDWRPPTARLRHAPGGGPVLPRRARRSCEPPAAGAVACHDPDRGLLRKPPGFSIQQGVGGPAGQSAGSAGARWSGRPRSWAVHDG
jgi:hypothetical protein